MATPIWTGTVDGDWDNTGNWSTAAVPINNDTVIIPSTATRSITTNLDQTAKNAGAGIDLDSLYVHPGYAGHIGSSGNSLMIGCDKLVFMGAGEFWYQNAPAGLNTDEVRIMAATQGTVVNLGGNTITNLVVLRGKVTVDGTTGAMARLDVGYMTDRINDVHMTIAASAGTLTDLFQWGGRLWSSNVITNATVQSAELTKQSTTAITNLDSMPGSRCIYNSTGTITLAHIRGLLDLTQSGDVKTVTTSIVYPGGDLKKIAELHTFTNATEDLRAVA